MDFTEMMALEAHGPDTFVGVGPEYPWGGLYGGQIVAQGLRAAGLTVDPEFRVHSLHAYFVRRGDATEPIRFEVDRVRNGRSFVTRTVVARQSTGAILTMTASFHVAEDAPEVQVARMPDTVGPDALGDDSWSARFERRTIASADEPGRARAWMRVADALGDDPLLHACGIAYVSDDLPTEPLAAMHPDRTDRAHEEGRFMSASLDHALWFHRPARADVWHLEDFSAGGLTGSRGMSVGNVFLADGTHVATIAQEVLIRVRRHDR
jgi:acyl-CoA thioesterase II